MRTQKHVWMYLSLSASEELLKELYEWESRWLKKAEHYKHSGLCQKKKLLGWKYVDSEVLWISASSVFNLCSPLANIFAC